MVIYDPIADRDAAFHEYGVSHYDRSCRRGHSRPSCSQCAIVLSRHSGANGLEAMLAPGGLIYDVTGLLPPGESDARI